MGARIKMVAVSTPAFQFIRRGSISLTASAARQCLKKAECDPKSLGLIVNTGIYRNEHIAEPAIASLIQRRIGVNPLHAGENGIESNGGKGTFSFDLNNGGCGLVSGMQLVDGFIQSREVRTGMVVTGDAEPFRNLSKSFGFAPAAAAVLLSEADGESGFVRFKTTTFQQFKHSFESHISWTRWGKKGKKQNVLMINEKEDYLDLCVECTVQAFFSFLEESRLRPDDIDLILPSQSPKGYIKKLQERIGLTDRFVEVISKRGELHTAGPAFALDRVWHDGRFNKAGNILFVSAGSGITTALALYKNNPGR
jgi:3-oxoacyl-[acyl-carrier-protein] synthase-3